MEKLGIMLLGTLPRSGDQGTIVCTQNPRPLEYLDMDVQEEMGTAFAPLPLLLRTELFAHDLMDRRLRASRYDPHKGLCGNRETV